MSIPLPTNPLGNLPAKIGSYFFKKTDKYQDIKNQAETLQTSDISNNEKYIMDDIVYDRKQLEESALKYDMEFKEYMRKMYNKGMDIYTGLDATDDELQTKVKTIIDRQENAVYNTDLTEEQVEELKNRGITLTAGDNQQTEYIYETKDGKFRRTRDTLDEEEIKQLAQQTYLDLIQSDEYFSNYDDSWVKNNQAFIDQQVLALQSKYDVRTEEGLKKANEELSIIVGNKIQESANSDEEYQTRMSNYDTIIGETYGKQLYYRDLVSDRQELIKETMPEWLYNLSPDFSTYVVNGWWQLMEGKDKTDWGVQSPRLKKVKNFLENPTKSVADYNSEQTYNFNGYWNERQGVTTYEQTFKTREEAVAWAKEETVRLEKSRAANFLEAAEYQRKIQLLGAPEFFDKDLDFEWDIDTYQRVLGTQGFQMIAAIPSFGTSTFYQEAGGMLTGMTVYHAAALAFPELESEEAINKYMELGEKEQLKYANEAFDNGLVNYEDAVNGGMQNAGYDLVSNFFTVFKAAKGVKFLPKVFTNLASKKAWKELAKYSWKNVMAGVKDIAAPALAEVVTENAQELTSKYYIDKNTVGDSLQQSFNKYFVEDPRGFLETSVQSALVPGTLVGTSKILGGGYKITNSVISDLQALRDPKHLRNYANKRLKVLEDQLAKGEINEEQYANEVIDLETAVETVKNSKNCLLYTSDAADE